MPASGRIEASVIPCVREVKAVLFIEYLDKPQVV